MSSKYNLVKKPEKDEIDDIQDEDELEFEERKENKKNNNAAKKRMIMFMGVILGGTILLLIVLFICSFLVKKTYSFSELETVLKDAAVAYFKDHPEYLPSDEGDIVEIDSSNLVVDGKMKDLSQYTKDGVSCTGYVQIEKSGSEYLYSPFLNCGDNYSTIELYSKVVSSDNIVTSGYGLYEINGEYIFRGEDVKNYVQLDNSLWRIVKVTNSNNIVLVSEDGIPYSQPWDDRYNEDRMYESGINQYSASRLKEYLYKVYDNPSEEDGEEILSKKDKSQVVSYAVCTGKRATTSESSDNSLECSDKLENQKLGLLTLSDYMMASIDPSCKTSLNKSCMNYNYLAKDFDWWLVTANSGDNSTVFMVDRNGYISANNASNYSIVRPVIYLNSKVMYKSGDGSIEKPYTLK